MKIHASPHSLNVDTIPDGIVSVDVCFDDDRVWSVDVRGRTDSARAHVFVWPEALSSALTGRTRITVRDSQTGNALASADAVFDDSRERTRVVSPTGTPLVVNKWGRLGAPLAALEVEERQRLVQRSTALISVLESWGMAPFVVGGTLLGGVRSGSLLLHDDDVDLAYLSAHTAPSDVAIEAFRVGKQLAAAGYEIRRHSATHLQLLFRDSAGAIQSYIDVFAAFFSADGYINQPFHVRGKLHRDELLPFRRIEIEGVPFPAPARPERWLAVNYDENWRTPIPGYVLRTPLATRRRFDNWFGSFNLHREFWDERFAQAAVTPRSEPPPPDQPWGAGAAWLETEAEGFTAATLIDMGCGDGTLTRRLALCGPANHVLGLDFSDTALQQARDEAAPESAAVSFAHANFYRLTALGAPSAHGITGPFDAVANHLFDQVGHRGREQGWRLLRMALRSGGSARFTFHAAHAPEVTFADPTGWHLTPAELTAEAGAYGLRVEFTALNSSATAAHSRRPTGARVFLVSAPAVRGESTLTTHPGRLP